MAAVKGNRGTSQGRPIKPSLALQRRYYSKLMALVDEMQKSTVYWILAEYKRQLPRVDELMASDASPTKDMLARLREIMARQRRKFYSRARPMAEWFASRSNSTSSAMAKTSMQEALGWTVGMRMTRNVNNILQSVIAENVNLIKSIPDKYFTEVEGLVLRSVREGRDISGLTDDLQQRYGITRRRALTIARDQNNKATSAITRARMQDAGITLAIWRHGGRAKVPRESHVRADGKIFDVREGLMIDGKRTWPGVEINCGCYWIPYIERARSRSEAARAAYKARGGSL